MLRKDLLALSADDLAAITNRGAVKRAQRELDAGAITCDILDQAEELVFEWSDGITCRFPHDKSIHEAICTSGTTGVSRHVVRSVLAYQRLTNQAGTKGPHESARREASINPELTASSELESSQQSASWDPGAISDEDLIARFRKSAITKARKRFAQGMLVELTRGAKPTARFLDESCTVRFLVPGDLRYIHADCADSLLPTWVPLAVWAFRKLATDQVAGLVSIQFADLPIPTSLFEELDELLTELCREGLSGISVSWADRLSRTETAFWNDGLTWPAELVADLLQQHEMYTQHDARFEPQQLLHVTGELLVRMRAISRNIKAVPQPLIRGSRSDRPTQIAGGRMIGVGLGVRTGKRHATLSAFLQEVDSGALVAVERTFAEEDQQLNEPRSFSALAETVVSRGVTLASLATSQLLVKTGKRTPSGVLTLPRTTGSLSTNPQTYQWEQLKPPFAAENFEQLAARFAALPPSYLRPRRRTENLHVVAITSAKDVKFQPTHQRMTAILRDAKGDTAQLVHPFHARGGKAFDAFYETLQNNGEQVCFICGHVRQAARSLEIRPISVVFDDDERRTSMQPWVTEASNQIMSESTVEHLGSEPRIVDEFLMQMVEALTDLLLTGVEASDARRWADHCEIGRQLGFTRLIRPIESLAESLASRENDLRWDVSHAVGQVRELCLLARVAME